VDTVHKQVKGSKSAREKTTPPPMVILEKIFVLTLGTNNFVHTNFLPLNFSHLNNNNNNNNNNKCNSKETNHPKSVRTDERLQFCNIQI
jgi:hypothetical protein